ncbi:unnamed protein product [Caenorhabditis auriculariae]|uniref:Golgi apparatus protein 1 n=1 Tax=Caenorhabditis auriculariae TaxID=2777116 RepID=A0A8S1HIE2_9PELO|nr:unnamed protein product [Caenorhabditis auriculariae]
MEADETAGQNAQQQPAANANAADQSLLSFDACKEDIHKYCNKDGVDLKSDISILECLQDAGQSESTTLTQQCESLVWDFKVKLTQDDRFITAAKQYCEAELKEHAGMSHCVTLTEPGYALSCLIDYVQNVTQTSKCYAFLSRTERLAFSDFRLIGPFITKCRSVLDQYGCNTLTPNAAHKGVRVPHTQGMALECILDRVVKNAKTQADALAALGEDCKHEVLRLAEMQSDDFHLDRPLYFSCRQDREKYCKDVPSGQGKVFECLIMHRNDQFMAPECSKLLAERAYMMGRDYRIAHPLTKACQAEMTKYKCEPQSQLEAAAHFHMSWILLCLENGANLPENHENGPSKECGHEMLTHRQMMMQHFQMAPEIVMQCAQEIDKWCSPRGDIEAEGRTMHCLMGHAQSRNETEKLGAQCQQALANVVKAADIGRNYKVDTVLYGSCRALIDGPCAQDAVSEMATLTCLMRHVDNSDMSKDCEKRLLEVQYFLSRDWTLEPQLYEACHAEAVSRCSAIDNWHLQNNAANKVDPGPQVLACLYRSAYDEYNPLSIPCGQQVRQLLHMRAARVNLIPEIEDSCREALSEFCSNNVKPMEEMMCLQENFEKDVFKKKYEHCHRELVRFTEMEAKDTKLNRALTKACKPVISTHCEQFANEEIDHGDVLECLLRNKNTPEMTPKCRSYVNHFELISMRDYHFNYRFEKACKADIELNCKDHGNDKGEIIRCLSEVRFEHKVLGTAKDLSDACRKQLKVAYLQQEQVEFDDKEHMSEADPKLSEKCSREIVQFKCDHADTFEDTVECLRLNFEQLGPECKSMVFYREKIEAVDNSMDDELQRKCKYDLGKFCPNSDPEHVLECLTNSKIVRLLQRECKAIVKERMQEAARDVRLRPGLLNACRKEAETYCPDDMKKLNMPQYSQQVLDGVVVSCLRDKFRQSISDKSQINFSQQCTHEVSRTIVEAELDPKLDPPLYNACKSVISLHCSEAVIASGGHFENVLECLKADFYKNAISNKECNEQLARRTQEALVDIHLDPSLHEACAVDIQRLCAEVPPGHSRIIMCLMNAADNSNAHMSQHCRAKLEDRNKLWMKAHAEYQMAMPETWHDLATLVMEHPQKVSILGYLGAFVLLILFIGCCCGRATKRTHCFLVRLLDPLLHSSLLGKMSVTVILRHSADPDRQLIIRNTTCHDVVVKFVNRSGIVHIQRKNALVLAGKYIVLTFTAPSSLRKVKDAADIQIYARPITSFNKHDLRSWLESGASEKEHRHVETLHFVADESSFAANKVIIDLPGKASLVESVPRACFADERTRQLAEADVDTAEAFGAYELSPMIPKGGRKSKVRVTKPDNQEGGTYCGDRAADRCFLGPLFDTLFPSTEQKSLKV